MFAGRNAELAAVRAELRAAGTAGTVGNGPARRVVVEGPEGIGKTALVRQALRGEPAARVLSASGDEAERQLRLGVVRQLVEIEGEIDGEGDGEGDGARGAEGDDPWAAGRALGEEIGRLEADGPVIVFLDDVQWADRLSLRALTYLLRRLRGRVLVIVACRDAADPWLPEGLRRLLAEEGTARVTLGGLSAAELAGLAPEPLTERAARRLRAHTGGNPLHALALLAGVPAALLADPGAHLPAPDTYARPFARRLRACGPDTRALVAACAVLGGRNPLHVAAGVARLEEPLAALEGAVDAGLLRELPGRSVAFPGPLARAAAYDTLGAGVRSRLHLAAAQLVEDTGTALRHRAAAAGGPDDALAEDLARFAGKAAQHGQWLEAASHLELAAGLCESPARRDELHTSVLEHVLVGGDAVRAAELAAEPNADPRPVRRYVLGRLALVTGRFDEAADLLAGAWRDREPSFAADAAEQLAWLHLVTGDPAGAASWAGLAIDQPIQSAAGRPYDVLALSSARSPGGPAPAGAEGPARPSGGPAPAGDEGLAGGLRRLRDGDARAASAVLARTVPELERAGLPHHRLLASAMLAVAEHLEGRWEDAVERGERALAEARGLGQRWLVPCLHVVCVAPLTVRGEQDRAHAHAGAARAAARAQRHALGETQADLALSLLGAAAAPPGADDPFVPDHRPHLVETLVAEGRLDEAAAALAGDDPGQGGRTRAERARLDGLLLAARNVPAQAEERFTAALALVEGGACPMEEALVLLDLGRLLRRTGRRRAAAGRLRAAGAIFARLGARPLAAGCEQELEACGLEQTGNVRLGLTPQEHSTARLVADGLTNRQIARELLISVKTVEYHIGKIYTKLGIGSRVALAARLAALDDGA